jgi:hypothetical protein
MPTKFTITITTITLFALKLNDDRRPVHRRMRARVLQTKSNYTASNLEGCGQDRSHDSSTLPD